jgi:hypothetical protein
VFVNPVNPSGLPKFYVPVPPPPVPFIEKRRTSQMAPHTIILTKILDKSKKVNHLVYFNSEGISVKKEGGI